MDRHYLISIALDSQKKPNLSRGGDGKPRVFKRRPGCLRVGDPAVFLVSGDGSNETPGAAGPSGAGSEKSTCRPMITAPDSARAMEEGGRLRQGASKEVLAAVRGFRFGWASRWDVGLENEYAGQKRG